jgi:NTP pyrophosphatase (non-canonical NTP hydrolase)
VERISDSTLSLAQLKESVKSFCTERDWDRYHNAKDLCIGVCTEASELLEHFRFKSETEVADVMANAQTRAKVTEEMADVLFFLIRLSERYNVDLASSLISKLKTNATHYPVEKARGSNKKYSEF